MAKYSNAMSKIVDSQIKTITTALENMRDDFPNELGSPDLTEEEFCNIAIAKVRQVLLNRVMDLNGFESKMLL